MPLSATIRFIARLGFAAKGLVAVMIGVMALRLALGRGGRITGPTGVLHVFLHEPFGLAALGLLAVGLWCHAAWKAVQAVGDPEHKGDGFAAVMERVSFGLTAVGYAVLGTAAVRLLLGQSLGSAADLDRFARNALSAHLGRWAVGLIGAVVIVAAAVQLRFAATAGFRHVLPLDRFGPAGRRAVVSIATFGYVALAILSALIGYFLVRVALSYDASAAGGWGRALEFLAGFEHGRWLLGLTAAGIVCYGLYFLIQVAYREF